MGIYNNDNNDNLYYGYSMGTVSIIIVIMGMIYLGIYYRIKKKYGIDYGYLLFHGYLLLFNDNKIYH